MDLWLWPVGSERMLGVTASPRVDGAGDPIWTPNLKFHPYDEAIYGDFEVCPFRPDQRGELQLVCIESASHVVVTQYPSSKH